MLTSDLKSFLLSRHYVVSETENISIEANYLNAYLLANFGIILDKPSFINKDIVKHISDTFKLEVPKSFYANPQDTRFFKKSELLVEQIVSYFAYGSDLKRIEVFKKDLPEYTVGDELKLRIFYVLSEKDANDVLSEITNSYCSYTRPFSKEELDEFIYLFKNGYYNFSNELKCKDNIFAVLPLNIKFAASLDKKDIVKLSISKFGEQASFNFNNIDRKELKEIASYIPYVKSCPLSKKQAKYFNKIVSLCGLTLPKETNVMSPDRRAAKFLLRGDVVGAAQLYADHGSMLERRIKMLLSRATPFEAAEILDLLPAKNPIVLYQLMSNIISDSGDARTFTFYHNNKVKVHHETDYEARYRKSNLNTATCKFLHEICTEKIRDYYRNLSSLGKIYIADNFYKIGLPTNTSASGKGIDVIPIGSHLPVNSNKIRTFVHWKDAFDIDSSLIVVDKNDNLSTTGWFNYGEKRFGNDILFSGDVTSATGAEYFDIDLEALAKKGYKYVVQAFHGFRSKLDRGEIFAGYQNKENFNTKAWDPKNIEMQFRVFGKSRGCVAFAIDIQSREMIIINQIIESDERVVNPSGFKTIAKYLQPEYLNVNIGMIAECCGELVSDPFEADLVFDDTFVAGVDLTENKCCKMPKIIRSYELEKLVAFVNR